MFSSSTPPVRHIVIRKRVVRRHEPSGLAEFAQAAPRHRVFFRTLAICLVVAVIAILWGFGLIRFDWRDEIRSLIREAAGR